MSITDSITIYNLNPDYRISILSKTRLKNLLLLSGIFLLGNGWISAYAQETQKATKETAAINQLLTRLDLTSSELERVQASKDSPELAAQELLNYYRSRSAVRHTVDRQSKLVAHGQYAVEKELKMADDALEHIFVGQPAYPPYFCGDDIDWSTKPVKDNEWVWQLNRMYFWDALAKAYWHTGDEKYAQAWCHQLVDWVSKNPRDQQHAYAWRSIEAGIRGHRWTSLFQHFLDAPSFTPEVLVSFLNSCYDHATYLMTQYSTGSNWALMEAEGLAFIAIVFPEFKDAKTWRDEAIRRLNAEISKQVYPDGHQRELAMGYHVGSIRWFMRTFTLANLNDQQDAFPTSYLTTIEKMCEVPMKLGFPDGTNPQFGDAWTGKPGQYSKQFKEWADLFDREDFLYLATEGKKGTPPQATAFALKESGLYSLRNNWQSDAICLVLKCGPDGGGHCQPDNGTFSLFAGGRHLMPDAGSYIYSGDPENRAWFRQTKVHQTLTLNGENSEYAPRCLLWEPGENMDVLVVENKSYSNLTHQRAVCFVDKKYFVIVDEALGEAQGNVDLHFQLAPGEAVFDQKNLSVRTDFADGWNVLVKTVEQPSIRLEEEEGQVSFEYTKKEPRPAFRYRIPKQQANHVQFVTIIFPYQGSPPAVEVQLLEASKIGASRQVLEVMVNGSPKQITYELP